jgi:hypothetical protein
MHWNAKVKIKQDFSIAQGELEHRTPKARYRRTDRNGFIKQMTQIERREARIRKIEAMNPPAEVLEDKRTTAPDPEIHHFIGKTQNFPENIPPFLEKNQGDPAFKVRDFQCLTSHLTSLTVLARISHQS